MFVVRRFVCVSAAQWKFPERRLPSSALIYASHNTSSHIDHLTGSFLMYSCWNGNSLFRTPTHAHRSPIISSAIEDFDLLINMISTSIWKSALTRIYWIGILYVYRYTYVHKSDVTCTIWKCIPNTRIQLLYFDSYYRLFSFFFLQSKYSTNMHTAYIYLLV